MDQKGDNAALYLFHQGTNYCAFAYLGAHEAEGNVTFRVWAPHAHAAFVVGDFNGWEESLPMTRLSEGGVWEAALAADKLAPGMRYKYKFHTDKGELYKADPYGRYMECPPETASVYLSESDYTWRDGGWMAHRRRCDAVHAPLNIYEVHPGSWKRHEDGSYYSYRELADELAPYVKQMGYTHVELMPVMEHPFDGSWGYQVCGYYAPSARYGTPDDLRYLVDTLHGAGIGVILDWVPAHFPKDAHGLYEFDGEPLYEYQGWDRMEHEGWGTRRFDVGRNEVQSFLVSNAAYWIESFHADGLRVDAVASMLYLDYDRRPGEWIPNVYGDNRCLEAISFFKKLNGHIRGLHPDVLMIAEESSAWANITGFENDGLGFSFKWNMGWMNDMLAYAETDPIFRKYNHNNLTFSLTYAFGEHYILPVSHDEVVHGKCSFLDKMPGDYEQKFAGTRAFMAYMMTHPGKKLSFMGNEIGQFREWDYAGQIEWFLLDYDMHAKLQYYAAALNHFYLENPPLWERDDSWDGFRWINADDGERSIYSYRRIDAKGRELIVVLNLTPVMREDYALWVSEEGSYRVVFNSDAKDFGGGGVAVGETLLYSREQRLSLTLPPMSALILRLVRRKKKKTT